MVKVLVEVVINQVVVQEAMANIAVVVPGDTVVEVCSRVLQEDTDMGQVPTAAL